MRAYSQIKYSFFQLLLNIPIMLPDWILSEQFWLPVGTGWSDVQRGPGIFLQAIPWLALLITVLRFYVESYLAHPLGLHCRVSNRTCSAPAQSSVLWQAYSCNRIPGEDQEARLAQQLGWTQYRVHKWFWKARNYKKPSTLTKFKESSWKVIFYSGATLYGFAILIKEPCFWSQRECYRDYPHSDPNHSVLSYWAIQLAFYCSLLVSQPNDVKRNDLKQLLVHHLATLALLLTSYAIGMVYIGALILLIHDGSDILLELAKALHYTRKERASQVIFVFFAAVFFITRLVIYPFWLVWSVAFDIPVYVGSFPALKYILLLLLTLQALHLYWFWLIAGMGLRLAQGQDVRGDARSDSEVSSCSSREVKIPRIEGEGK